MTKEKIKEALKAVEEDYGEAIVYPLMDMDEIERVVSDIEQKINDLTFGVYMRGSSDGMDYWLQCEYYSDKIMKTIVWDYDYTSSFDGEQEFIDVLCNTAKEIEAFESRLSLSKK